jgi:CMP/dCMP kinase
MDKAASAVARLAKVRAALVARQRKLGEQGGVVMEGRDIGTVVFPDAPLKLFLVAAPEERAGRRVDERGATDVAEALHARDRLDARVNPHVPAGDAVVIDTSDLGVEGTLRAALEAVASLAPGLLVPEGPRGDEEGSRS